MTIAELGLQQLKEFIAKSGFEQLTAQFGISVRSHPQYPQLKHLKYNMIASPMHMALVQVCRGLIVDSETLDHNGEVTVVARPFDKFFNLGEGHAPAIHWGTAMAQEKIDGSLMYLYHFKDEWHVSSSGLPHAGGQTGTVEGTFAQLFWKAWHGHGYRLPVDTSLTWMFELTSPVNRVVVPYKTNMLTLIGVRSRETGQEWWPGNFAHLYATPKQEVATSELALRALFNDFSGLDQEGFVVVDKDFHQVKVKHPQYVALHQLRGNGTPSTRRIVRLIQTGETEEIKAVFPEFKQYIEPAEAAFDELCREANTAFAANKDAADQKTFALAVKNLRVGSACFGLRRGFVSTPREFYAGMPTDNLMKLLGLEVREESDDALAG